MKELLRTNDPVLLSFVDSLLKGAGIDHVVMDTNMSILEGSIGVLPRRVLVADGLWPRASDILEAAGIELDQSHV